MSAESRQDFVRIRTLGLARVLGKIVETRNLESFTEAKALAQELAQELNMLSGLERIAPLRTNDVDEVIRTFLVSVGRLSKTCEAFDHLEDFPYRLTLEQHIGIILDL